MNRKTSKPQPVTLPGMPEQAAASTHLPPQNHLGDLQNALLDWFAANQRRLPWRVNYTPYEVWISEVMLQQTQMERGVSYFNRWMQRFPARKTCCASGKALATIHAPDTS